MTKDRVCANDTDAPKTEMPEMRDYLDELQCKMTRLAGVMSAISFLVGEKECRDGQAALIFLAEDFAKEINNDLDSVNRPEVTL